MRDGWGQGVNRDEVVVLRQEYRLTNSLPPHTPDCPTPSPQKTRDLRTSPHASFLLAPLMEHVTGGLALRYAALDAAAAAPEALAQLFLDLAWLDGALGGAGGRKMSRGGRVTGE